MSSSTTNKAAQVTGILSNSDLARIERLRINATRRFTNKSRGEHLSGKGGTSTDFSDYRDYAAGDDVRFVDWNIFSRLNRPYLKLYRQEEEMHVLLLLDASTSMDYEGKFELARQLAASFGVMGLLNNERVSVYVFNSREGAVRRLPPCTGRASMAKFFRFLENLECGGDTPLEEGVDETLQHHYGRGVAFVLSDFHTFGNVKTALNRLFGTGLEIFALQLLAPVELDPELTGDLRLVDCETQGILDISAANELIAIYHDYLELQKRDLESLCKGRAGRFARISSEIPLKKVLFDSLMRLGWIR